MKTLKIVGIILAGVGVAALIMTVLHSGQRQQPQTLSGPTENGPVNNSNAEITKGSQAPPNQQAKTLPKRVKIPGDSINDPGRYVYGFPHGSSIGKVSAGSVLLILNERDVNGSIWYGVQLESGSMMTLERPDSPPLPLPRAWIPTFDKLEYPE